MAGENSCRDPLDRLIRDHESTSEYAEDLEKVLGFLHDEEAWRKIQPIDDFFKCNLIEHFNFEEKIIFPAILLKIANTESVKLILELQKEHGSILKELEAFRQIISGAKFPLDKDTAIRLGAVARNIINSLLAHAAKEDENLLPIIEKNTGIFTR